MSKMTPFNLSVYIALNVIYTYFLMWCVFNRKRFKDGIDIIDLNTSDVFRDFVKENNLKTNNKLTVR